MFTDLAISAYALSMLGLRSANGTSTVILTRVGLNCSTVLGTLVTPVIRAGGSDGTAGRARPRPRQSYGRGVRRGQPAADRRRRPVGWWRACRVPYTRPADVRSCGRRGA